MISNIFWFVILCHSFLPSSSSEITCKYRNDHEWEILKKIPYCYVENQDVVINQTHQTIAKIKNKTESYRAIEIHYGRTFYFPRGIQDILTNLDAIWIHHTHLRMVTKEDLKYYTNLKVLKLPNNDIKMLEKDLFVNNVKLESISFANNPIIYIDPNVFESLNDLKQLDLRFIYCHRYLKKIEHGGKNNITKYIVQPMQKSKCSNASYEVVAKELNNFGSNIAMRLALLNEINDFKEENEKLNNEIKNLTEMVKLDEKADFHDESVIQKLKKFEYITLMCVIGGISLLTILIHCCICRCSRKKIVIVQENLNDMEKTNNLYGVNLPADVPIYEELKF